MNTTRRFPAALGLGFAALLVVASALGAGYLAARESDGDTATLAGSEDPQPTATPITPTPGETATTEQAAQGQAGDSSEELVYAVFGQSADSLMSFDPESRNAAELLKIPHAPNYGITGSVSANGVIAYLALPTNFGGPQANLATAYAAELWTVNGGKPQKLAAGFDLHGVPAWHPEGEQVAVQTIEYSPERSQAPASIELVDLEGEIDTLVERDGVLALDVIGYSQDGSKLYFAESLLGGTTIVQEADLGSGEISEITRGDDYIEFVSWTVGEDEIAAMAVDSAGDGEPKRHVVTIGISDDNLGDRTEVASDDETLSPAWLDGQLSFSSPFGGSINGVTVLGANGVQQLGAAGGGGLVVPQHWSADGQFLAGLSFARFPPTQPGRPFVLLPDGVRVDVPANGEVTLLGWR